MKVFGFVFLFFSIALLGCSGPEASNPSFVEGKDANESVSTLHHQNIKWALLGTRFESFDDLLTVIQIRYYLEGSEFGKPTVLVWHPSVDKGVLSVLEEGISQNDFIQARDGSFWDKVSLAFRSPYTVWKRKDLARVFYLSRRKHKIFGEGDVAFYDLAELMECNIREDGRDTLRITDLTEKGFINTFNHINAQALMTTLYSEEVADFIADVHERKNMPELITGDFTPEQIADLETGAVDNYVDMINNEWGQELGKELTLKHGITSTTEWTPELLAAYLNDIQVYYAEALPYSFEPITPDHWVIQRFAAKINAVNTDVPKLEAKQ